MADSPDLELVAPGVVRLRVLFVNLYFVGDPDGDEPWVLVDAGLPLSADTILRAAAERFGDRAPAAIVLTHGHFDHVGALRALAEHWNVPVYAHPLEMPYLTGRSAYPPPDPSVGGGAMARLSFLYPKAPLDLGGRVQALPESGSVPALPQWRWISTPGHSPGHVSLFRDSDRTLIAGDAFVTVKQESAAAVMAQYPEVHGPPAYFTPDWPAARASVERLAALKPALAATGHGVPMQGARLEVELEALARHFDQRAIPAHGRYVGTPAQTDERGVVSVPPRPASSRVALALAAGGGLLLALRWARRTGNPSR